MRDHPNKRMISHFKKMIGVTRGRIEVAKKRCNQLRKQYDEGMNAKMSKKPVKSKKRKDDYNDRLLEVLESDDDGDEEDVIELGNKCNIDLSFDSNSSSISNRVSDNSESTVSTDSSSIEVTTTTNLKE